MKLEISKDIILKTALLSTGTVFYMKNPEDLTGDNTPHYHIVLNHDPLKDTYLILVFFVTMRERHFNGGNYVDFAKNSYTFIDRPSLIDCDTPIRKTAKELLIKIETNCLQVLSEQISEEDVIKIRSKVLSSKIVEKNIINLLK